MKTVILCIGNRDGGDDAVGPLIADKLTKGKDENRIVIDAGIAPENFTGVVKKHHPDALIIIDAVDMNLSYGAIRRVPPERIGLMHVSTHGIPLSVLIKYLQQYVQNIILLGVQPKTMSGALSEKVRNSIETIITSIINDTVDDFELLS